ncbi:MAG: RNA 2',3'-cyclic phosphodiesterase [Bacteroidetes bacterium]|nr:RNA 2',3'-cyclic phosphodiesterase [Bacteroidota bacterium]
MPRLFIAIDTPSTVRPALIEARNKMKAIRTDVKWESDDKLHCTLKFLGDTDAGVVQDIQRCLQEIAGTFSPLSVMYSGLGYFPNRREPRIIWAGIRDPQTMLTSLARSVDQAVSAFGFELERRAFAPHVTLGRVKGRRGIGELLDTLETITFDCPPVLIHEMLLVQSELRPSGSVYSIVARMELQHLKMEN